jgi:hypothetical protein
MKIPLNGFDEHIDEKILKRGLLYFRKGEVLAFDEVGSGEYEAVVRGTEDYSVKLTVKNGMITGNSCDCPYDMGPFCKHEVAALFHLQQDELGLNKKKDAAGSPKTRKTKKRKTIAEQVDDLLEKATQEELRQFLREQAAGNVSFRNLILSSFAQYDGEESQEGYVKQLKSILRGATDREGFIDWSASSHVGQTVDKLQLLATKRLESGNFRSAFFIATAIMEQMVDALQYADDSHGDIGSCIQSAREVLNEVARKQDSEELRTLILDYCFAAFERRIYSGWDWEIDMLRIAATLVQKKEEVDRLNACLDSLQRSEYRIEVAQGIRYEVIAKTEGQAEADKYLEAHLANSTLRKVAIAKAFEDKEYEKAGAIALDGVMYDTKRRFPGLVIDWYDWLLKIAQATNDIDKVIEYARILLIENFSHKQDYYEVLKTHIEPEHWSAYLEMLIVDISGKNRWHSDGLVADIFIREAMWSRLLELVRQSPMLERFAQYESYLSKHYPTELIELYAKGVVDYLQNNMGRNHYQVACRFLRRMNKLGGRNRVDEVIVSLKSAYSNRKALLEELGMV